MALTGKSLFLGSFIHSKSLDELELLKDSAILVDEKGIIVAIEPDCSQERAEKEIFEKLGWSRGDVKVYTSSEDQFFFPGFIDTHIHASQYPNAGVFGKTTLLDWLQKHTFPTESSLASLPKAQTVYTRCIQRTLSHGTTTAAYYATTSVPSTNLLADLCLSHGQRAFIGRCNMDTTLNPEYYRDASPEYALADTRATITHIQSIDPTHALITPILTPRFAPSCSSPLMHGLAALHQETKYPIQTHIGENTSEIALVAELFPSHDSYAHVYDVHGLLGPSTILGHAVYLTSDEVELIRERGAKIAHCPASNSALTSGAAKVRNLLDKGIEVGLGTDVSGGYSASILEAVKQALLTSNHVSLEEDGGAKLSVNEALYLATRGGAKVVGLEEKIGGFGVGMEFDAQLVGLGRVGDEYGFDAGTVDVFGEEEWDEKVAKWVYGGDDRNTLKVWVKGRLVHERKI